MIVAFSLSEYLWSFLLETCFIRTIEAFLKLVLWTLSCPASQKSPAVGSRAADVLSGSSFSLCCVSVTPLPVLGPPVPFCWDSFNFWRCIVIFQRLLLLNNIFLEEKGKVILQTLGSFLSY